jgi:hypothetical protein
MAVIRRDIGEHVQSDGKFKITRIEIYEMVGALRRDVMQQFLGQVAVGVNYPDSVAKGDMLNDQIPEERGLSGARFSDDVYVLSLVSGRYAKRLRVAPTFAVSDDDGWFVIHGSRISRRSFPH